ncbi:pyridoxamine 5'-phosphate oxidase family protein [Dongia sp.]|uniref:pyridoxamine 5'-phosphate oxidase family protein n=1 Tax=Dongia sp. TaxID=1977262 RepID=UPI0035B3D703
MNQADVEALLNGAFCGRTATVGADGYPYIAPNLFVWMDGQVYLHTPRHKGHFLANVQHSDRVSFEVDEPGEIFPYGHVECDTSVSYRSVIIFGRIRTCVDKDEQRAFFSAFLTKYAPKESWGREIGSFPRLAGPIVYAIRPEIVTGKFSALPGVEERWPSQNNTLSPNWKPKSTRLRTHRGFPFGRERDSISVEEIGSCHDTN